MEVAGAIMIKPMPNHAPAMLAVAAELNYQHMTWGEREPDAYSGGTAFDRSLDEYTLYIQRYANMMAAKNCVTAGDFKRKVHLARKIAALSVACLAQHGCLTRREEEQDKLA